MRCIENISLEIKVFKSLFVQIIDGLNFWHIDDDSVTILKYVPKRRRIFFLKPRFILVFRGNRTEISRRQESFGGGGRGRAGGRKKLALENICNSVDFAWFSGVNKRWVISRRQQSVKGDY